jgi:hypothetical protein
LAAGEGQGRRRREKRREKGGRRREEREKLREDRAERRDGRDYSELEVPDSDLERPLPAEPELDTRDSMCEPVTALPRERASIIASGVALFGNNTPAHSQIKIQKNKQVYKIIHLSGVLISGGTSVTQTVHVAHTRFCSKPTF